MTTEKKINDLVESIKSSTDRLAWYIKHNLDPRLAGLDYELMYGGLLDFNQPDRETTLEIIKRFPGKWQKEESRGMMHYMLVLTEPIFDSIIRLRIFNGKPPPSCKVVVEEVVIPEHKEKRQRIVCDTEEL